MHKKRFSKSLARWNSFIEAVDLEVCSHMHVVSVFHMSENLRRIAKMSCPPELDKTSSRCAEDFDTNFVFQDAFGAFKLTGRETQLLQIASELGRGSLSAGTLVCQVFHWFYVGSPRATTSYKACISALLSSDKLHLELLARMVETHGMHNVFARCSYRCAQEATRNYILLEADFMSLSGKLVITIAWVSGWPLPLLQRQRSAQRSAAYRIRRRRACAGRAP